MYNSKLQAMLQQCSSTYCQRRARQAMYRSFYSLNNTDRPFVEKFITYWLSVKGQDKTQRWSPRGYILKSLALASKVKSLALASRPQVLENWPVLGSRTALFFELLKFCEALENFFGKRFFWRSLEKFL